MESNNQNFITKLEHDETYRVKKVSNFELNEDGNLARATSTKAIKMADSASIDAFARMRVSGPETLFDSKQIFDNQPLFWDELEVSGAGTASTWSQDTASTKMTVSLNTAGKRVRQTFMRPNYQPGKSQMILMTGTLGNGGGGTGITRCIGQFDDNNGIFMRDNEGIVEAVIRSNVTGTPVDTAVAQSAWNMDVLDGTGDSGITLDGTKSQIVVFDYEWLGVGRVRIGFVFNGIPVYVHEFNHSNILAGVYMSTPNNPLRYEIENDGTGVASELEHICCTVMSEGGTQKLGVLRHYDSPSLTGLTSGVNYVMMAGRLKSTHLGATIEVESFSALTPSTNNFCHWHLVAGGTVTGTLTFVDQPDSAVQVADGAKTVTHNGDGLEIDGGFFSSSLPVSVGLINALKLGSAIDGTPQEFYIVVKPITNNVSVDTSVTWRELN